MAQYEMRGDYTVGSGPDMWVVVVCLVRIHKTAKSDYQLRHSACPSVRLFIRMEQVGSY